ncbi:MAG: dimethylsulfoxide reductase subunit B [Anaerolineae bacterium]|nr:dimethylsulfoxide reductase subunit B [Anaerolineae bacterium]
MATKQYGFHVDLSACIGCKACQVACKDKNDLEVGRLWRRVVEVTGGDWIQRGAAWQTTVFGYYISTSCQHCEKPACLEACPAQAIMKRPDGIVVINQDACIGCRYCEWACPYGAPQFQAELGKMSKCNFCYDYIDQGKAPACVSSCPMRALDYGELSELQAKYGTLNDVAPLPDPAITEPAIVFTPHKDVSRSKTEPVHIGNREEV